MRNLHLWNITQERFKISPEEKFILCRGRDEESNLNTMYVCTHNLIVRLYDSTGEIKWRKDLSKISSPQNNPLNITYLGLQSMLCIGLENGELISVKEAGEVCDLTGILEDGMLAMEWSPDQELLALVTKQFNMVLLSCNFEPINEVNLLTEDFGEKQFITVGWGKKETQFHGSEGKQAAQAKDEIIAEPTTDCKVKITWRGDGELFAIGFAIDGIRRFKVYDREGNLQYTSEKQQGLESNLSWRPSGNLIATTQRFPDKYLVSFFEKNGLKHGEFYLKLDITTRVENIIWSADSEVLTLQCYDSHTHTPSILLYTMGNYHWYLKQTLVFHRDQKINKILWNNDSDIIHQKILHVVLKNGFHYCYTWVWEVNHSKGKSIDDNGMVAVIDGDNLLLTAFRQAVIPPPMAALDIILPYSINYVIFAPTKQTDEDIDTNTFCVLTSNNKVLFCEQELASPLQYKVTKNLDFPKQDFPLQFYNFCWINSNTLICIMMDSIDIYTMVEFIIEPNELKVKNTYSMPAAVTRIQPHPSDNSSAFLQLENGEITQYTLGGVITSLDTLPTACFPCPRFYMLEVSGKLHYMGITLKGNLYIDDVSAVSNVSSLFIHTHFILVTTLQHNMLCVELNESGLQALKEYQKNESNKVYKRRIERGAKLVIVVPCDTRTVFQMPRGNLEAIQPRPLSLKIIGELLDDLKYYEAFDLMRKQRINLNLIYDHDPDKFLANIDVFLQTIENNSWLNLFLSELENYDVTKTMYSSSYTDRPEDTSGSDDKIDKICDIVRDKLIMTLDTSKILTLITTHVKKNTIEEIENALLLIKERKNLEIQGCKYPVSADEALKYLLYMVDINRLFDIALGMYDFDLVLLVADKSQKDPKEYVPMLNEFNAMDEFYKQFSINKHLKRFDRAVKCLWKCGPKRHNELRTFVKYHSLYKEALAILTSKEEIFKQISDDYGVYLKLKKHYTHAGIIYERASLVDKAIDCYKDALEWELAIKLGKTLPQDEFDELCLDLVNLLKEQNRHDEALLILQQYCNNIERTILYAIEFGRYKTALRLCTQDKEHMEGEKLFPAMRDEYNKMMELIDNKLKTFIKYKTRLHIVRQNKLKAPYNPYDYFSNKDCDLYSDAGSTLASSSKGSTRSVRSSKNRRKHERKLASLKEGSPYEDLALISTLHTLVTNSFEMRSQVKDIILVLYYLGLEKEALSLQNSLQKLLTEMKEGFKEIWTNELVLESTKAIIAAQNAQEGFNVKSLMIACLEPHVRIAPVIPEINWTFEGFE